MIWYKILKLILILRFLLSPLQQFTAFSFDASSAGLTNSQYFEAFPSIVAFGYLNAFGQSILSILMYHDICLTGFRTSEFLTLTRFSCDPANHALRGSSKTEAGKDCIVPVHAKLQPYNNWRSQENNPYDCLICNRHAKASKDKTCWKVLIFAYFLFSSPILSFFVHTAMNKLMILWTITYGKARCHPL